MPGACQDANGKLICYEGTIEDITQRKCAEVEAQAARSAAEAARSAAEAASAAKGDFLATMSHEIRTPLNGVIGVADLLAHTPMNPLQARYVKIIQSSSDSLLAIINQILDFSKIEAGKLELAEREFDLPETVDEVVAILAQKAAAKGLELACRIDPEVPARVRGDDDRLRQILLNITNNAIKFTLRGECAGALSSMDAPTEKEGSRKDHGTTLRFSVTDTGPGIPQKQMGRLFKSFSQVDCSVTRQFGGTGLGLAISKQLVELMGGAIGVESTPGKGSVFWFTLRLGLDESPKHQAAPFDFAGRRVLIVEDSPTQCEALQQQLRKWRLDALYATSAALALDMLQSAADRGRSFELALLDLNMPEMGGLELARAIRASTGLADLPLILMGGMETAALVEESVLAEFLTKPIRQSSLLDSVMKALVHPKNMLDKSPHALVQLPACKCTA